MEPMAAVTCEGCCELCDKSSAKSLREERKKKKKKTKKKKKKKKTKKKQTINELHVATTTGYSTAQSPRVKSEYSVKF